MKELNKYLERLNVMIEGSIKALFTSVPKTVPHTAKHWEHNIKSLLELKSFIEARIKDEWKDIAAKRVEAMRGNGQENQD